MVQRSSAHNMAEHIHIAIEGPDGSLRISPPMFPENSIDVSPSDLTKIAPTGNGVYGLQRQPFEDPFKLGPKQDPVGGVLYFDNGIEEENLLALSKVVGMWKNKSYAAYAVESQTPREDGYLRQLRLVDRFALTSLFQNALKREDYESFPEQELTMPEALWAFIEHEKKDWGTHFGAAKLEGKFGGDGDFAREKLSFGLMVENPYFHVYRIWSRAWLVTK